MRAKLNFLILAIVLTTFPAMSLAHPGHEGHGYPPGMAPIHMGDVLFAIGVATLLMGIGYGAQALLRWWRSSN